MFHCCCDLTEADDDWRDLPSSTDTPTAAPTAAAPSSHWRHDQDAGHNEQGLDTTFNDGDDEDEDTDVDGADGEVETGEDEEAAGAAAVTEADEDVCVCCSEAWLSCTCADDESMVCTAVGWAAGGRGRGAAPSETATRSASRTPDQ